MPPAKAKRKAAKKPARPKAPEVVVDPMDAPERVYADHQPRLGTFVRVVSGPHKGRYGVFHSVGEEHAGWPTTAVVRTRDDEDEQLVLDYGDLRPSEAGHR